MTFDDDILKGFNLDPDSFFKGYVPLKDVTYSIAVIYSNGNRKDFHGIKNPWQFMNFLKKNPNIKSYWIIQ